MKHLENKENYAPFRGITGLLKKHIRKTPWSKRTALGLLRNNINKSNTETSTTERKDFNMITSLKEVLDDSNVDYVKRTHVTSESITLKGEKRNQTETFKLFKESEVPLFTLGLTNVSLSEPGCDNDCQTTVFLLSSFL